MSSDREIVDKIRSGEKNAFRQLLMEHKRLVEHIVFRLIPNQADREEICQEVFLKVYENLHSFHFKSRLGTWIGRIAFNTSMNHLRKKGPELYEDFSKMQQDEDKALMFESILESDEPSPEIHSEEQDRKLIMQRLINKITQPYRTILILFHLDGQNYQEIGEIMSMPEGTVKSYLFRARKMMREQYQTLLQGEEL